MPSGFAPLSKAAPHDAAPNLAPLPQRSEASLVAMAPLVPTAADCVAVAAIAAGLPAGKVAMQAAAQQQLNTAAAVQLPPTAEQQQQLGFLPYKWRHHPLPRGAAAGVGHHHMQQQQPPSLLQLGKRSASDSLALDLPRKRAHMP